MNRRLFLQAGAGISLGGLSAVNAATAFAWGGCGEEQQPVSTPQVLSLRSAENPYGPPPAALTAAQQQLATSYLYPRSQANALREVLAQQNGLTVDHVGIGAGSIELILQAGLAFGKPGRAILAADPTWDTLATYSESLGAEWMRVPLTKTFHHDFDRMRNSLTDKVDLVYICHPNNPTGLAEEHDQLEAFVKEMAADRLVMVDEAFLDCVDNCDQVSMKKLLPQYENLIIVRTFSKLWGMAGFRVGYLLAHPHLVQRMNSSIPYLLMQNGVGTAAAAAALQDHSFLDFSRGKMRESHQIIGEILNRRGLEFVPSDINFVSFKVPANQQDFVAKLKREQKVIVKPVTLGDGAAWGRVSCGTPDELARFDDALGKLL